MSACRKGSGLEEAFPKRGHQAWEVSKESPRIRGLPGRIPPDKAKEGALIGFACGSHLAATFWPLTPRF